MRDFSTVLIAFFNDILVTASLHTSPELFKILLFSFYGRFFHSFNCLFVCLFVVVVVDVVVVLFCFFDSLARSKYLFFFSHSFSFILWSARTAKLIILQILFCCCCCFCCYYYVWSSG